MIALHNLHYEALPREGSKMETVLLKNGVEEVKPLVAGTMLSLRTLLKDQPMAFYELVELCRDATHQIWGDLSEELEKVGLISLHTLESGSIVPIVHSSIRNIVISAVSGSGLDMALKSPVEAGNTK